MITTMINYTRCGSLVLAKIPATWNFQKDVLTRKSDETAVQAKKSGIFEISKIVKNTIFTCTKKTHVSRVSVLHFSSKYLKRISWCVYPTV